MREIYISVILVFDWMIIIVEVCVTCDLFEMVVFYIFHFEQEGEFVCRIFSCRTHAGE